MLDKPVDYPSAKIIDNKYCNCCGWPIVFVCCNGSFRDFNPTGEGGESAGDWDWWYYCSNKVCENHVGEGIWQNRPDWVSLIES